MKTKTTAALALLGILALGISDCQAVDTRRVNTHARSAPAWVNSASNFNDPASSFNSPASRDRTDAATLQPNWNPTLPANDPLRNNLSGNFYDPSDSDEPLSLQRWRLGIYPEPTRAFYSLRSYKVRPPSGRVWK